MRIRQIELDDAHHIAEIQQAVWADSSPRIEQIRQVTLDPNHVTIGVADEKDVIVAFADGFLTTAANGLVRWEIDLVAVHPECQGQGIGKLLVQHLLDLGAMRGAKIARALVQTENANMQKVMAKLGLNNNAVAYHLYIASGRPADTINKAHTSVHPGVHLINVKTMSYSGLWIENNWSKASLVHALNQNNTDNGVVGTLISENYEDEQHFAQELGYKYIDAYHWWILEYD